MPSADETERYRLLRTERLGEGCFGVTYKCVHNETERVVAAKLVSKENLELRQLGREIPILEKIRDVHSENLIELFDFIPSDPKVWIIMEYCNYGNLEELVYKKLWWRWMLTAEIQHIFKQIAASGMRVLYAKEIVHRDLKPANVLLHNTNGGRFVSVRDLTVKIADFNLSIMLSEKGKLTMSTEARGSFPYQAPEYLDVPLGGYGAKVDLWSIGIMLYQCSMKAPFRTPPLPFKGKRRELIELFKHEPVPEFPNWYTILGRTLELRNLISQLLAINAEDRISFDAFFANPFVNDQ